MEKVSVIIPVYNCEKYLKRCVMSVLNQTLKEIQLILVDDGSTDGSGKICDELSDSRIIVIHKENGGGAGATRNLGLEKATAPYVMFMDSDDWMQANMIEEMYNAISLQKVDLVICGYRNIFVEDRESKLNYDSIPKKTKIEGKENIRDYVVNNFPDGMLGYPWNKIYKKSIIDSKSLRFPLMRRLQDGIFNLDYFDSISSCYVLDESLYNYRASQNIIKKKLPYDFFELIISFVEQYKQKLEKWGYGSEILKGPMATHFQDGFVNCLENFYLSKEKINNKKRNAIFDEYYANPVVQVMLKCPMKVSRYSRIVLKQYMKKHYRIIAGVVHGKNFVKLRMGKFFEVLKRIFS